MTAAEKTVADYVICGVNIVPIWGTNELRKCMCDKGESCPTPGKHPYSILAPNGYNNASCDPEIVRAWSKGHPAINWAVRTGDPLPGGGYLAVLDMDPRNSGDGTLGALVSKHGVLPPTVEVETGGKGRHWYFRTPAPLACSTIGSGLEIKAKGGYVVAPPSRHASGGVYSWLPNRGLGEIPIAEMPEWLSAGLMEGKLRVVPTGAQRARDSLLGEAFVLAGVPWTDAGDKLYVLCPWRAEHSGMPSETPDSSTVILPPNDGTHFGSFKCLHSHCAGRNWKDVLEHLPSGAVEIAKAKYPLRPTAVVEVVDSEGETHEVDTEEMSEFKKQLSFSQTKGGGYVVANDDVNVVTIFSREPRWKGVLGYDEFKQDVVLTKPAPWHPNDVTPLDSSNIRETDGLRFSMWLTRYYHMKVPPERCVAAVQLAATGNPIHPVRDYLTSLKWDGVNRLETFLIDVAGAEDNDYTRTVTKKWLISAVARIMQPGCKVDTMLILEGEQGIRKSSLLRELTGPEWFSDTPIMIGDKDGYQSMRGKWIIELAELSSLKGRDAEKAKAFFSSPVDYYRPSYARVNTEFKRQCVFVGTTNSDEYLSDPTGNRRYWPVYCHKRIDIVQVAEIRNQIWAEAYTRFLRGEPWYLENVEQERALAEVVVDRTFSDEWTAPVAGFVHSLPPRSQFTGLDIATKVLNIQVKDYSRADQVRVGYILKGLGIKRKRTSDGMVYRK